MNTVAAVILAAGASSRFGAVKQTAHFRGKTFVERQLDVLSGISNVDPFVVLGAHSSRVESALGRRPVERIFNEDWAQGVSSSIKAAVTHLSEKYDKLVFIAVDQILLESRHISALIQLGFEHPHAIIACRYSKSHYGIPVLFPRKFYSELGVLEGDVGAKRVAAKHLDNVIFYDCPEARVDIDTQRELDQL